MDHEVQPSFGEDPVFIVYLTVVLWSSWYRAALALAFPTADLILFPETHTDRPIATDMSVLALDNRKIDFDRSPLHTKPAGPEPMRAPRAADHSLGGICYCNAGVC